MFSTGCILLGAFVLNSVLLGIEAVPTNSHDPSSQEALGREETMKLGLSFG